MVGAIHSALILCMGFLIFTASPSVAGTGQLLEVVRLEIDGDVVSAEVRDPALLDHFVTTLQSRGFWQTNITEVSRTASGVRVDQERREVMLQDDGVWMVKRANSPGILGAAFDHDGYYNVLIDGSVARRPVVEGHRSAHVWQLPVSSDVRFSGPWLAGDQFAIATPDELIYGRVGSENLARVEASVHGEVIVSPGSDVRVAAFVEPDGESTLSLMVWNEDGRSIYSEPGILPGELVECAFNSSGRYLLVARYAAEGLVSSHVADLSTGTRTAFGDAPASPRFILSGGGNILMTLHSSLQDSEVPDVALYSLSSESPFTVIREFRIDGIVYEAWVSGSAHYLALKTRVPGSDSVRLQLYSVATGDLLGEVLESTTIHGLGFISDDILVSGSRLGSQIPINGNEMIFYAVGRWGE